eukprot:CAMPEP_0167766102 /NCGR_PEP_ID=MMETSP0110_2-20121227/15124_1 /TAXON_ID=629695 /ORGANISM="Gymnochlora sp., Strain CCMP2014" /LENGTH=306 /DNA_ID=CAMNT_0007654025 /DNA_START=135 /DNA_END=1052 /DNA_ORIENTATION=+
MNQLNTGMTRTSRSSSLGANVWPSIAERKLRQRLSYDEPATTPTERPTPTPTTRQRKRKSVMLAAKAKAEVAIIGDSLTIGVDTIQHFMKFPRCYNSAKRIKIRGDCPLIPKEIQCMENVEEIKVSSKFAPLRLPPPFMMKMNSLKVLNLMGTGLHSLTGISNLMSLEHIDVSFNHVKIVPKKLFRLPLLCVLKINNNRIRRISIPNKNSVSMKKLDISNNLLESLSLLKLANLESLEVQDNNLEKLSIPSSLQYLDVRNNNVSTLPMSGHPCVELQEMRIVHGNKLEPKPYDELSHPELYFNDPE